MNRPGEFDALCGCALALSASALYVLARTLGLARPGATLAAAGYATSTAVLAGLFDGAVSSPPMLPWLCLSIEAVRRSAARRRRAAVAVVALATAGAVWLGHAHAVTFDLACAAVWIAARARRDGGSALWAGAGMVLGLVCAAPLLAPSFAWARAGSTAVDAARGLVRADFLWLACWAFFAAAALRWRALVARERNERAAAWTARDAADAAMLAACVIAFAFVALPRADVERVWLPVAVIAGACVSTAAPRGVLPDRAAALWLAVACTLLAARAPGVAELWRAVPFAGEIDPARAAGAGALFTALVAGEMLEVERRGARAATAVLILAATAALVLRPAHDGAPLDASFGAVDPEDELVGWIERPPDVLEGDGATLAGWVHPGLEVDRVRVRAERVDEGAAAADAVDLPTTWDEASAPPDAPAGARAFRTSEIDTRALTPGVWRFRAELWRSDGGGKDVLLGFRTAALSSVRESAKWRSASTWVALAVVLLLCLPRWDAATAWTWVAIAAAHGVWHARTWLAEVDVRGPAHAPELVRLVAADEHASTSWWASAVAVAVLACLALSACFPRRDGVRP